MGIALLVIISALFVTDNKEFFDKVEKDIEAGYTWHLVGPIDADPNSLSISMESEGYNPQIIWKLKKD
jgi:hypothetical protein|tara:strand:- start:549 stop:752 length:204 start_codon:yes stop_codon:yes gene_type:complete